MRARHPYVASREEGEQMEKRRGSIINSWSFDISEVRGSFLMEQGVGVSTRPVKTQKLALPGVGFTEPLELKTGGAQLASQARVSREEGHVPGRFSRKKLDTTFRLSSDRERAKGTVACEALESRFCIRDSKERLGAGTGKADHSDELGTCFSKDNYPQT